MFINVIVDELFNGNNHETVVRSGSKLTSRTNLNAWFYSRIRRAMGKLTFSVNV